MKLQRIAERVVTILGLFLLGPLTVCSFFSTIYFKTDGEETPYLKGDFFPLVVVGCLLLLFFLYKMAQWVLKASREQDSQYSGKGKRNG